MRLNIGIDGPVGAGKSSVADAVAEKLGILHLDTDNAIEKSKSPDDLYQDLVSRVRLYHPSGKESTFRTKRKSRNSAGRLT